MCRSMAAELGAQDDSGCSIRVNTLSPGYIRTAMTDQLLAEKPDLTTLWLEGSMLGKLAAPDEFRGPVLFLLSHASSFMTGADLRVDGGHCAW
jgi:NAD(P)-dependent dehydrogenase (short-subunit alcohol dehydrogenase family)